MTNASNKGLKLLAVGLALVAMLAVGLAIGLWVQLQSTTERVVEVVVTVTPDPASQAVAQSSDQTNASAPQTGVQAESSLPTPQAQGETSVAAADETATAQTTDNETTKDTATTTEATPTPTIMDFLLSDARHFEGDPDAPVTLIEFSDFKCPYCGRFATGPLGRLRKEYIETGKVRFVYKHFAILGPESNRAAEASECAAEQGQFWAYHDLLFADQAANRSLLNDEKLISLANDIGLDANALGECLRSNRYTNQIRQESQAVQALGVRGTPGFVVNGIYVAGAQPYETFAQIFDEQLARLGVEVPTIQAPTAADTEIEGVLTFSAQSRTHQEGDIDYEHDVPPGGVHNAAWQNCGIYDEPVRAENVMHSLEHGAVWLAYQPGLPDDQVELLRTLARQALAQRDEPMVILSPQPDLDAPIVATAWQIQLKVDDAADERLVDFLVRYQGGPFTPEPGAPCTGGVGEPLE